MTTGPSATSSTAGSSPSTRRPASWRLRRPYPEVSVTGEASTTVGAQVSETVEAEGEGVYYDDGWGGRTAETAQRDAEQNLSAAMDEAMRLRRERASQEAD